MDDISEARLKDVHPLLAEKIREMAVLLAQKGITIRVTQGLRTWDEQDALYQQGRTTPGKIVTNAAAGTSYHNFGLAVDVVPITDQGPDWDPTHPVWAKIIATGKTLGLVSGAMFRSFPDAPHFQLTGNLPTSPSPQVRNLYNTNGLTAVWTATGLGPVPPEEEVTA